MDGSRTDPASVVGCVDQSLSSTPGSAGLAYSLAILTGVVDAVAFTRCGILPSVMTANLIFIASNAFRGMWGAVSLAVVAIAAYFVGAVVAGLMAQGESLPDRSRRLAIVEGALLGGVALIGAVELVMHDVWQLDVDKYLVVVAVAVAMAVQTTQVRVVDGTPISTTYLTGSLSMLGYGLFDRSGDAGLAGRRVRLVGLLLAYAIGGLVGGFTTTFFPGWGLIVPFGLYVVGWVWLERRGAAGRDVGVG